MEENYESDEYEFFDANDEEPAIKLPFASTPRIVAREESIPLVLYNNEKGTYEICAEALEFLRTIQGPIGVVAVAGMYRTGKSFLLNRMLLNRKAGFNVGPTINPCTKGLWIWGQPIQGTTQSGEPCNILVIDSEGLGALDQDSNHDCKIFSLAILLSSLFIYNSVGSIDENALQNLGLVVNLTEHIHIKSQQSEVDCEDYAQYFPSFLWVVRDFILQLVTPEGESMTSREYFEAALQPQKGFSDAAEEKNRIRRLLKNFFKDRDCQTLVRPVTDEGELQTLAEKEIDELRPEFVEQMMELRQKALGHIKVKTLNGKAIDGNMLAHLADMYVNSINSGTVPNIENAWTYICQNESNKAYSDAVSIYEKVIMTSVGSRFPLDEVELKEIHREAKESAIDHFTSKCMGSETDNLLSKLKNTISDKIETLKVENEEEGEKICRGFLTENYAGIDRKLKENQIPNFVEFQKTIRSFEEFFLEHGPAGPNRREIALEFVHSKTLDASDYFIKHSANELELKNQMSQQHITKLEGDLVQIKEEGLKERDSLQSRICNTETEKAELKAKEQSLMLQLDSIKEERGNLEARYQQEISELKSEYKERLAEEGSRSGQVEEAMKDYERKLFEAQAEFEQEKALLTQQVEFQKNTIEEANKRSSDQMAEFTEGATKQSESFKELQGRYDTQIQGLNSKLEAATESITSLEQANAEKDALLEKERTAWETERSDYDAKFQIFQKEMKTLKSAVESKEGLSQKKIDEIVSGNEESLTKLQARLQETERKLRQTEENSSADRATLEKDNAVMIQKVEFLETQLKENIEQYEESKRTQERMVAAMQDVNSDDQMRQELECQLEHIKQSHITELRAAEAEFEMEKKSLRSTIETLEGAKNDLELKIKMDTGDLSYANEQQNEKIQNLESELAKAQQELAQYEADSEKNKEEVEQQLRARVAEMDSQIRDIEQSSKAEIEDINTKSEQSLTELKDYYEIEKQRVEQRLADEKSKAERRYNLMSEEYEQRLREDREQLEDEIAALQDEISDVHSSNNSDFASLRQQKSLDTQKIETLELHLKETKESLSAIHASHANSMEAQLASFNQERQNLLEKIEKLASESATKDRELTASVYKREQLDSIIESKGKELDDIKGEVNKERAIMIERLEDAKLKNQTIADEFIQKKNDYKREIALTTQHIEFQAKKITDLERALEEANKRYNEKLKTLKDETGYEFNDTIEKLTTEKNNLERRLDTKRNEYKELEISRTRQVNTLEKEKAVMTEKYSTLETKMQELDTKYQKEVKDLGKQLGEAKETDNQDRMSLHLENERLKTLTQELEKEVNERNSSYERDRTLWENKFNFLAQQRDQSRHELADAQRKFEQTLEQLQKRGSFEKDKLENTTSSLLNSVETRYMNQIKELQDTHSSGMTEVTERNKQLESENRLLKEELQIERRSRTSDSGTLEKRLSASQESEGNLKKQIMSLREEKESRIGSMASEHDKEKENLRTKIGELEKRTKEAENYRGHLFLEHEKERAKWALERDHLINEKSDAKDMIERLEKRKEALLRENEKFRSERGPRARVMGMMRKDAVPRPTSMSGVAASMSFEEFNTARLQEGSSTSTGNTTPRSERVDKSPPPRSRNYNGMVPYSPGLPTRELQEKNSATSDQ